MVTFLKDTLGTCGVKSQETYTHEDVISILTWYISVYSWIANNNMTMNTADHRKLANKLFDNK
jgi:hypothetical protein